MSEVIKVSFRMGHIQYCLGPDGLGLEDGRPIVAETPRGMELGRVVRMPAGTRPAQAPTRVRSISRLATDADVRQDQDNREGEAEARVICAAKVREHNLSMRLVCVQYTLDRSRLIFSFSSEGRVDFRELVRDLAREFRTRIELVQVGVRDQARMVGGYGSCGRRLCCAAFLDDFQPVAIRMAKEQGLSLNPTKISGMCGRLLCCLRYEYDTYRDLRRDAPKVGATVETPAGPGVVKDCEILRGRVEVEFGEGDQAGETAWFGIDELVLPKPVPPKRKARVRERRGGRRKGRRAAGAEPPQGGSP